MPESPLISGNETLCPSNSYILFGPYKENAYTLEYARKMVRDKFGVDETSGISSSRKERLQMWKNLESLRQTIFSETGEVNIIDKVYAHIKDLNNFARTQLESLPANGLGIHLKEVTQFSKAFLLTADCSSRFPGIISDRNALLLAEVVSPLHDVLKFLGTTEAQVIPDHEVITSAFVKECFPGKRVLLNGQLILLTTKDINLIANVIGDHENIFKEQGRSNFINSNSETERVKALFFIFDVLTGVFVPAKHTGSFQIDPAQLDSRFSDLYFRHIDLEKGKIFRPEWGAYAIGDILSSLETLEQQGLTFEISDDGKATKEILIDAALNSIQKAKSESNRRQSSNSPLFFGVSQARLLDEAEIQLKKLKG